MAEENKVYDWDDEITYDGNDVNFVTLDEGDYEYEVTEFTRSNYTPSEKSTLPACAMAVIKIKVSDGNGGCTYITDNFPLCSKMEWKISQFHRSVGLKKHGETTKMRWAESVGLKGKVHVTQTPGKKEGTVFNNIGRWLDPEDEKGDDTWS